MFGSVNGINMKEIRNVWKSDLFIESLYCGKESGSYELYVNSSCYGRGCFCTLESYDSVVVAIAA
jgi:hypothetical protein